MRILQVIDVLEVGGAEKLLITLSNLQNRNKDIVSIVTILRPGPLVKYLDPELKLISLNRKWKFSPITMFRFVQIAKDYDLIHVHSSHNLRYVFLSLNIFFLKTKVVFHEHSGKININKQVKWYMRIIYTKINLIGVSQSICNWAVNDCGIESKKVHFLPNIIPFQKFSGHPQKKYDKIFFIATCNILRPKNIEFLIDLFVQINKNNLCKLSIVGQPYDKLYYDELKLKISGLKYKNSIEFIHDCTNIQSILHNYHFALHCSKFESGPLVLIEYLAQGVPFLSYRTGDIAELLLNDFPEFIIDNFDLAKWNNALDKVMSLDRFETALTMRKFYENFFSEDSYYLKCNEIYKRVLGY